MTVKRVFRAVWIGGMALGLAGTVGYSSVLRVDKPVDQDPISMKLRETYKDLQSVTVDSWETLPFSVQPLTVEEREKRLAAVDKELKQAEMEQVRSKSIISEMEPGFQAVEKDFKDGKLSAEDKQLLLNIFSEKRSKYEKVVQEMNSKISNLQKVKNQLLAAKEPETIRFGIAKIELPNSTVTQILFYNETKGRLATAEEIQIHPVAKEIQAQNPPVETVKKWNLTKILSRH